MSTRFFSYCACHLLSLSTSSPLRMRCLRGPRVQVSLSGVQNSPVAGPIGTFQASTSYALPLLPLLAASFIGYNE